MILSGHERTEKQQVVAYFKVLPLAIAWGLKREPATTSVSETESNRTLPKALPLEQTFSVVRRDDKKTKLLFLSSPENNHSTKTEFFRMTWV
jgi:hypothetical protein